MHALNWAVGGGYILIIKVGSLTGRYFIHAKYAAR